MAKLVLSFTPPPHSELVSTCFSHDRLDGEVRARLGAYDRSFKWTAGVRALSVLLLRTVAWNRNGRDENNPPYLEGRRPSAAASLNDVLTSQPRWVEDVFGNLNGRPVLPTLIGRWNADFNTSAKAPVRLWLERGQLSPDAIQIVVGDMPVQDAHQLAALADDVAMQCRNAKTCDTPTSIAHAGSQPMPKGNSGTVGVRLSVGRETVLIEIELDRDFDTFGPNDEAEVLRAVQALLRTSREIPVRGKRRGSVILTLELTPEEAKELMAAAAAGALRKFGVVAANPAIRPPELRKSFGRESQQDRFIDAVLLNSEEVSSAIAAESDTPCPPPERYRGYLSTLVRLQAAPRLEGKVDLSGVVQRTLSEAEDVAERWQGWSSEERFAWLRRVLGRNLTDEVRRGMPHVRDSTFPMSIEQALDDSSARLEQPFSAGEVSENQKVEWNENLLRLTTALDSLPEDERRAVELHHLMGMTLKEAANMMGKTPPSVAGLLRRGQRRLRELLA